jgi:preprotein translocase subunit YajC
METLISFLPLMIILGVFFYFTSRRQRKAVQATMDLQNSLRVGDRVTTTSGLHAVITTVGEDTVDLEIAPGVVTQWMKLAIRNRIEAESQGAELTGSDSDRLSND